MYRNKEFSLVQKRGEEARTEHDNCPLAISRKCEYSYIPFQSPTFSTHEVYKHGSCPGERQVSILCQGGISTLAQ